MKWANALKEYLKKFTEAERAASHNNISGCTDTNGLLEHSPSGGSLYYKGPVLQKITPVLLWVPLMQPPPLEDSPIQCGTQTPRAKHCAAPGDALQLPGWKGRLTEKR